MMLTLGPNLLQLTAAVQGCGSVLATQNIDTISFAYSTQQRCRTSQPFVKPRLIARPAQAPPRPSSAAADQKLPETAESIKEPAELAQQNNSFHSAVMGSCETLSAQEADCQAKQSSRTYLSGTAVSSDCAGSGGNSATQNSDCQGPEQKPLEGFPSGLFKPTQANEGSVCESGGGTRHLSSCASVSTQYGRCNACVEEEHVHEAADEAEGTADDSESEAAALLCWLEGLQLRYFTPREIANLHSFPASFSFPMHVTRRQQYALLGNSLSAAVVADLLTYLLTL